LRYQIIVSDKEDGDTIAGTIRSEKVVAGMEYFENGHEDFLPEPADPTDRIDYSRGKSLISGSDCVLCHTESTPAVIPNYKTIATAYQNRQNITEELTQSLINGSKGKWGTIPMPPHPDLSAEDATAMVQYILSLADDRALLEWLPVQGHIRLPEGLAAERGRYVFWASYNDNGIGNNNQLFGYATHIFRPPYIPVSDNSKQNNMRSFASGRHDSALVDGKHVEYLMFSSLDLTDVRSLTIHILDSIDNWSGGSVEIRLNRTYGELIGSAEVIMGNDTLASRNVTVPVRAKIGLHDLFVVFPGDPGDKNGTVALTAIRFHH